MARDKRKNPKVGDEFYPIDNWTLMGLTKKDKFNINKDDLEKMKMIVTDAPEKVEVFDKAGGVGVRYKNEGKEKTYFGSTGIVVESLDEAYEILLNRLNIANERKINEAKELLEKFGYSVKK